MRVHVFFVGVVATFGCRDRSAPLAHDPPAFRDAGRVQDAEDPAAVGTSDVTTATPSPPGGGAAWRIGEPRMRVTRHAGGALAVSLGAMRAFATDGGEVKIWELQHGTLIARIAPPGTTGAAPASTVDEALSLAVSPQATRLAVYRAANLSVYEAPFATSRLSRPLASPLGFVDEATLLVDSKGPSVLPLDGVAPFVPYPGGPAAFSTLTAARFGTMIYVVTYRGVATWDLATGATTFAPSQHRWRAAAIARDAPIAVVRDDDALWTIDLKQPMEVRLPAVSARADIAPAGDLVIAASIGQLDVYDVEHRTLRTSIPLADVAIGTPRWTDVSGTFAVIAKGELHIVDLDGKARSFDPPSRFRAWRDNETALLARGPAVVTLAASTGVLAPLSTTPSTNNPPSLVGAPPWATWQLDGVAADSDARAGLPLSDRGPDHCPATLRVWTASGGERALTVPKSTRPITPDVPCWGLGGGRVVAVTWFAAYVLDPASGKLLARIDVDRAPGPVADDEVLPHLWTATLSPDGKRLALWWRRADVWHGPAPRVFDHDAEFQSDHPAAAPRECELDVEAQCKQEYFAEVWAVDGDKPRRLWRVRADSPVTTDRGWPLPKVATSPPTFTHDGSRILLGYDDGDIEIRDAVTGAQLDVERLHRAPVTHIELSPQDAYAFSEDDEGEQRIWPLRSSPPAK